jgi:hypothetical protein
MNFHYFLRLMLVAGLLVVSASLNATSADGNETAKTTRVEIAPPLGALEDPAGTLPEVPRLEGIQSPAQFFGFPIGSRHLRHDQVMAYFNYLEGVSDRVTRISYGQTHGGRPLAVWVITSPENHAQLPKLRQRRSRLTNGNWPADRDLAAEKLVMWLGYCVHGDEASAVNAAPLVAYHLASADLAALGDTLNELVFLVDPAMNPDGVDRFANWVNDNRGRFASAAAVDREHVQPWPGGRGNYYWFDLNRDWLPLAHPESQGRLQLFHRWKPNIVLDYHEMGGQSTYFFQPGIPARNNPLSPAENLRLTQEMAAGFARAMDDAKELYFTRESFDDFYIGKGSTYPDLNGSVGILFEQGSTRGLRLKNEQTDRHFRDTIANQVRTTMSAIERGRALKSELLKFQTEFYNQSLNNGRQDLTKAYLLTGTPSRLRAARRLLTQHAIRSAINSASLQFAGQSYAAGEVLIVPSAQPQHTLLRSLMETPQSFTENIFYDVSAWHLPSALDLDLHAWQADLPEQWTADRATAEAGSGRVSSQSVDSTADETGDRDVVETDRPAPGEILGLAFSPVELEAPTWVARLQQMGARVHVSQAPFRSGPTAAETLPAGTWVVLQQYQTENWVAIVRAVRRWQAQSTIKVSEWTTGLNLSGPDLGSGQLQVLPPCHPALVVGPGTTATEAGALWHFLDRRLEQPATLLDTDRLRRVSLAAYSSVILPEGSYEAWTATEAEALGSYMRQGGTVIAIGSAISWMQRQGLVEELQSAATGGAAVAVGGASSGTTGTAASVEPPRFADSRDRAALEQIAGAFFMARIDATHPLAFGFPDARVPVFRDSATRFGRTDLPYRVAASYDGVIAGYVSESNREKLAGTAAVWAQNVGSGRAILLADNPVFRGYVRSSERFLTNALYLGPTLTIPAARRED